MRRLVDAVSETNLGRHRISPATTSPTSFLITTFYAICARGINHYVKRSTIRLCWKLILTDHTHSRYRNLPSPLVDETREDHELLSLSFSLSYQTVIPNYERWWITITSRISSWTRQFSTFRTEHTVERADCSSLSWSAPFFAGRRKCARIGRSRYKRGSARQTRGMKRAGETRASFKRPLQRSLLRAFYEESGPINQRPPSDNWIHSLEIVRTFSQRSVSCLETVSLLLYRSSIKPDNWLIEGTIVITCGYAITTFT